MQTDPQRAVQDVLDRLTADGTEQGLQVAVYRHGRPLVDAWSGWASADDHARSVDGESLFNMSSCGKGVAATCLHVLAEQGKVDYDSPVAEYWPEFAAHGKAGVTVRHVLAHQSGIPRTPNNGPVELLIDWPAMCAAIADLTPMFEPGTKTAYQAVNFGFIVGELVRRIDGQPVGEFVQEVVGAPLAAPGLYFGVPTAELARVADLRPPPAAEGGVNRPPPTVGAGMFNRTDVRQAAIPSSGGISNARSLARHYAMLANDGELDGVRLLSAARVREVSALQTDAVDELYHAPIKRGLGYRLGDDTGAGAGPRAFGHVGNGMFGYADPDSGLAVALLRNALGPSRAGDQVMTALAGALAPSA